MIYCSTVVLNYICFSLLYLAADCYSPEEGI